MPGVTWTSADVPACVITDGAGNRKDRFEPGDEKPVFVNDPCRIDRRGTFKPNRKRGPLGDEAADDGANFQAIAEGVAVGERVRGGDANVRLRRPLTNAERRDESHKGRLRRGGIAQHRRHRER